jgi:hypothetical protein
MADPFIKHNGRERIYAFRIVTPGAMQGTTFEEDISPYSSTVVD